MEFRNLVANEIDVRVGQVGDGYCTLLLYKDARVDMDILDETVGSEKWQRKHYELKGNMYCSVGIYFGEVGWVWKDDCGTESNTEKEKGESSDSFKRACVNWGIGRELYTAPIIKFNCKTDGKKLAELTYFSVEEIIIENKTIKGISIKGYNKENRTNDIIFSWGKCKTTASKTAPTSQENKKVEQVANKEENKPFKTKEQAPLTLEEAREMVYTSKSGEKIKVAELTDEQLLVLSKYTKMPRLAEACAIVLEERQKVENEQGQNN